MEQFSIPYSYTGYPTLEETFLEYGAKTKDRFVYLWGPIGKTACCGSAHVVGLYLNASLIYEFLQNVRVSVLCIEHKECDPWGNSRTEIKKVQKELNYLLVGIGSVSFHQIDSLNLLILFDIHDKDKYEKWRGGFQ